MTSRPQPEETLVVSCPQCSVCLRIYSRNRLSAPVVCPRCARRGTVADFYASFVRHQSERRQPRPQQEIVPVAHTALSDTLIIAPQTNNRLAVLYGNGSCYELQVGLNYIGKHPQADDAHIVKLSKADAIGTVSRSHCIIEVRHSPREGYSYHIADNSSLNGTYLEGERLAPTQSYPLEPGQSIILGNLCRLTLKYESASQ